MSKPLFSNDQRHANPGRPPGESDNTGQEPPTDEQLLPRTTIIRAAGSVTLQDWDTEAFVLKGQISDLFRQISNRPRENGVPSNEYLLLEIEEVPEGKQTSIYRSKFGLERCTIGDALDVIRVNQGITARELTLKLFADAAAPPVLEPRVRSMLHRLKLKGWAMPRYDDRGVQRWYAPDLDGVPDEWDSRARAIAYTLVDLWGGRPRDYTRHVEALAALMDGQGERVADPKAWVVQRERPF